MHIKPKCIAGERNDGGNRTFQRIKITVLGGHRVHTIKAQGGHEIALLEHHGLIIDETEIGHVLREETLTCECTGIR